MKKTHVSQCFLIRWSKKEKKKKKKKKERLSEHTHIVFWLLGVIERPAYMLAHFKHYNQTILFRLCACEWAHLCMPACMHACVYTCACICVREFAFLSLLEVLDIHNAIWLYLLLISQNPLTSWRSHWICIKVHFLHRTNVLEQKITTAIRDNSPIWLT